MWTINMKRKLWEGYYNWLLFKYDGFSRRKFPFIISMFKGSSELIFEIRFMTSK